ncbi:complex I assembly factor TIMMDC1, mitochondrial-like [Anneissia japonica]|uniref:complex I assembly factor TIMMDC1, mitochondrial-like n=1 Tax=Anneissia japonica TaxID=1529436 RepID=UPI00142596FC|nr:complex I assembly factor TIMMDC1, mitochondrial-like [Anneissia japonica]
MDEITEKQVVGDSTKEIAVMDEMTEKAKKYKIPVESDGMARLKRVFTIDDEKEGLTQELYEMILIPLAGFIGGAIYGGLPAARHARHRFIDMSNAAMYTHRIEAVRAAQNAGSRGFIRYGFRWGWRTALLAGGFHFLATNLAIYRNKSDLLNYAVASGTMGALYRFNLGLRGLVGGAFAGSCLGIPAGVVMIVATYTLSGETMLERYRRIRIEIAGEKWEDLEMRKTMTPMMLDYMEEELRAKNLLPKKNEEQL